MGDIIIILWGLSLSVLFIDVYFGRKSVLEIFETGTVIIIIIIIIIIYFPSGTVIHYLTQFIRCYYIT